MPGEEAAVRVIIDLVAAAAIGLVWSGAFPSLSWWRASMAGLGAMYVVRFGAASGKVKP